MSMEDRLERAVTFVESNFQSYIAEVKALTRIPSVTNDAEACNLAAGWIVEKLESMALEHVQRFETVGNPIVFAEKASTNSNAPTILLYGHYDVQLPDPLDDWESPPYDPEQRGEYLYGRGTSDMKGQILAVLLAVEALLLQEHRPVNVKILIEGNEEAPPPALKEFLPAHRDLLKADISLNCDAGMLDPDMPTISYGLRGASINIIRVEGPSVDLHDGMYGGVVENPIHVLSQLIVGLHDDAGRITLPSFYDRVRELSKEERSLLAALPLDDQFYVENAGVSSLWGDQAYSPVERVGARPSLNVRLFKAGAVKSAIPRLAEARIGIRLVPKQDPLEVHEQLKQYVALNTPECVKTEVEYVTGYPPYLVDRSLPAMRSLSTALEAVWGIKPYLHLVGGGIPVVERFKQVLGVESLLTGFSLPGDHIHGPNERLHLPTVKKGIPALMLFFDTFGSS
jgi:acetylornithine deacetylase/succinyl-diaminopimelate desuccinylase-like protein